MRYSSVVTVGCLALGCFLFSGLARGEDRQPSPLGTDAARLEKRIADLERQLAAVLKELQEVRRELQAQTQPRVATVVIPLKRTDAAQIAKEMTQLLGDGRSSVVIVADEKVNSVIIRASADQIEQIKGILRRLDGEDK